MLPLSSFSGDGNLGTTFYQYLDEATPAKNWAAIGRVLVDAHNWAGNTAAINTRFALNISSAAMQFAKNKRASETSGIMY